MFKGNIGDLVKRVSVDLGVNHGEFLKRVVEYEGVLHRDRILKKEYRFHESYFYSAIGRVKDQYLEGFTK